MSNETANTPMGRQRGKTEHHTPNLLPPNHSREDFDFLYGDGVWGPIRIGGIHIPEIPVSIPAAVWCKRHFCWEDEVMKSEGRQRQ